MGLEAISEKVQWTSNEVTTKQLEDICRFPLIVKCTTKTSNEYSLSDDCAILLLIKQQLLREIAHFSKDGSKEFFTLRLQFTPNENQSLEESLQVVDMILGIRQTVKNLQETLFRSEYKIVVAQQVGKNCYVFGNQLDIPSTYNVQFHLCKDLERGEEPHKRFSSVQEVADAYPSVKNVYLLDDLCVTLPNNDGSGKFTTTCFEEGDELMIIKSLKSSPLSKPASHNLSSSSGSSLKNVLEVQSKRLGKNVKLPFNIRAPFASEPLPMTGLTEIEMREAVSLHQVIERANFPLTVTVQAVSGSQPSMNGGNELHAGMRLRLLRHFWGASLIIKLGHACHHHQHKRQASREGANSDVTLQ